MSNACPGCNKFPSLSCNEDPDVEINIEGATVTATIRLVRESECCGEEMKEANFEPELEIDPVEFEGHLAEDGEKLEGHDLEVEETGKEITERFEGKGRGTRTFYGVLVTFDVFCSCRGVKVAKESVGLLAKTPIFSGTISDECQASSMDWLT